MLCIWLGILFLFLLQFKPNFDCVIVDIFKHISIFLQVNIQIRYDIHVSYIVFSTFMLVISCIPSPTICFIFLGEYEHIWFRVPSHRTHLDCRHTLDSQFQLSIKNSFHPLSFRELQQSVCHSHQQKSPSQTVKS